MPDQMIAAPIGTFHDEPLVVSPRRAQEMLDLGVTKFYELLPELDSYKDGKSRKITVASIHAYIGRRLAESRTGTA
jgi:hypothetical protein